MSRDDDFTYREPVENLRVVHYKIHKEIQIPFRILISGQVGCPKAQIKALRNGNDHLAFRHAGSISEM
jgi:hypothetical protein